jgi:hypothetical protein
MSVFVCERCDTDYVTKKGLMQHLRKKNPCLTIKSDIKPEILIANLNQKDGIPCDKCNKVYKNNNSLRSHKCKPIDNNDKIEKLEHKINDLTNMIIELTKNPQVINNTTNNNTTNNITNNNTLNITLNCLMDTSGKPIEYLLNQEDILEKVLGWMKLNQKLISTYMKEKYYNIEHPENQMIRVGKNRDSIELFIGGKWRDYENAKGAGMILTNIGNDFGLFLEILKENPELYIEKYKIVKKFEKNIIKPLNWGLDVSEDTSQEETKQLAINEKGELVLEEDELERLQKIQMEDIAIKEVYGI